MDSKTLETLLGYASVLVIVIMYGSYYVPVKPYKTYDGTIFQWYTSAGMLVVGAFVGITTDLMQKPDGVSGLDCPWEGLVGGSMYALILSVFPFVVRLSGLAVGYVLWTATSIVVGWAISRFGLFGVTKTPASNELFDYAGICLCTVSLVFILLVKPDTSRVRLRSLSFAGFLDATDETAQIIKRLSMLPDEANNDGNNNNNAKSNNFGDIINTESESMDLMENSQTQPSTAKTDGAIPNENIRTNSGDYAGYGNNSMNALQPQSQAQAQAQGQSQSRLHYERGSITSLKTGTDKKLSHTLTAVTTSNKNTNEMENEKEKGNENDSGVITTTNTSSHSLRNRVGSAGVANLAAAAVVKSQYLPVPQSSLTSREAAFSLPIGGLVTETHSFPNNSNIRGSGTNVDLINNKRTRERVQSIDLQNSIAMGRAQGLLGGLTGMKLFGTQNRNSRRVLVTKHNDHQTTNERNNDSLVSAKSTRKTSSSMMINPGGINHVPISYYCGPFALDFTTVAAENEIDNTIREVLRHSLASHAPNDTSSAISDPMNPDKVNRNSMFSKITKNTKMFDKRKKENSNSNDDGYQRISDNMDNKNEMNGYTTDETKWESLPRNYDNYQTDGSIGGGGVSSGTETSLSTSPRRQRGKKDKNLKSISTRYSSSGYGSSSTMTPQPRQGSIPSMDNSNGIVIPLTNEENDIIHLNRPSTMPGMAGAGGGGIASGSMASTGWDANDLYTSLCYENQQIAVTKMANSEMNKYTLNNKYKRLIGCMMAIGQGAISALIYLPFLKWKEKVRKDELMLNYVFSFCLGIYIMSTLLILFMGLYKQIFVNDVPWQKPILRPAVVSGMMYALGYSGFLFATMYLEYAFVYVTMLVGSIIVSNLWSIFYFKEITDRESQKYMACGLLLMVCGIVLEALSS